MKSGKHIIYSHFRPFIFFPFNKSCVFQVWTYLLVSMKFCLQDMKYSRQCFLKKPYTVEKWYVIYYINSINLISLSLSVLNFLKNGWTYGHQIWWAYSTNHRKGSKLLFGGKNDPRVAPWGFTMSITCPTLSIHRK